MTEVLITSKRLRELEITAELGANMVGAINDADGDLMLILQGVQEVLTQYMARMALADFMEGQ